MTNKMQSNNHHEVGEAVAKVLTLVLAWLTSWTLGEIQQVVGILSGLVILGYTIEQWRRLRRKRPTETK